MVFKLSREQIAARDALATVLRGKAEALNVTIAAFNRGVGPLSRAVATSALCMELTLAHWFSYDKNLLSSFGVENRGEHRALRKEAVSHQPLRLLTPASLFISLSERIPDVVARTRAATENFGRGAGGRPDRLADTQIRVSYRGTGWVHDDATDLPDSVPAAGDRAPDAGGLTRHGLGFPLRLFDVLRGTGHVLVAHCAGADTPDLAAFALEISHAVQRRPEDRRRHLGR